MNNLPEEFSWSEYEAFMRKYHDNCERINNRIFKAIKNQLGQKFHDTLNELAIETEVSGAFALVKSPKGEYQPDEEWDMINGIWVDQRCVGEFGDSWEGQVYVKLKEGLFLEMAYAM